MHFTINEFWSLSVAAIFVQNMVFVSMLGENEFIKSAGNPFKALTYAACVTFFTTVASAFSWLVKIYILAPFGVYFLAPLSYVFIIACIELAAEFLLTKYWPNIRKSLGRLLPSTAFSCAVLGIVLLNINSFSAGFFGTVFFGFCAGLGFALSFAIIICSMEKLNFSTPPAPFSGLPISLITAGIISMAFMGFANIQIPY